MNGNAGLYPEYTLHTTQNTQKQNHTEYTECTNKIIPTLITEYTLHRTTYLLMQKKINQNTQNAQTLVLKKNQPTNTQNHKAYVKKNIKIEIDRKKKSYLV